MPSYLPHFCDARGQACIQVRLHIHAYAYTYTFNIRTCFALADEHFRQQCTKYWHSDRNLVRNLVGVRHN